MVQKLANKATHGYDWIDLDYSDKQAFLELARTLSLHEECIIDAFQADHVPKYQQLPHYLFIILRVYINPDHREGDTLRELTDKISIFISNDFLLTIRPVNWTMSQDICAAKVETGECKNCFEILNEIVKTGLLSYEEPIRKITDKIEYYEKYVFLKHHDIPILKGLYFIKRKVDVIRRIFVLSYEIIDKIDTLEKGNPVTRDIRDLHTRQHNLFDTLAENTNHLLSIYFNVSSQRTNETIRILTIFSVFFMPLTFIVGIYGMNFEFMPELQWTWGYPGVLLTMIIVVTIIFFWFRKKKWL